MDAMATDGFTPDDVIGRGDGAPAGWRGHGGELPFETDHHRGQLARPAAGPRGLRGAFAGTHGDVPIGPHTDGPRPRVEAPAA